MRSPRRGVANAERIGDAASAGTFMSFALERAAAARQVRA